MNPLAKILSLAAPSMVIGGLLFQSPVGHADDKNRGDVVIIKDKDQHKQKHKDQHKQKHQWSHGGAGPFNGNLDGIRALVRDRLQAARHAIQTANLPPPVRAKVLARFDRVNVIVDRRLAKIDFKNLDQLEAQMEGLGEEVEAAMEGLEEEMEALAKSGLLDGQLKKQLGNLNMHMRLGGDDDDDDDDDDGGGWRSLPMPPGSPVPPMPPGSPMPPMPPGSPVAAVPPVPPMPPAPPAPLAGYDTVDIAGNFDADFDSSQLRLRPDQRASLKAVRAASDAQIKAAKQSLDSLSDQLSTALRDVNAQPAQVTKLVDQISAQEAKIRKARITAWLQARALLDARQRGLLEDGQ